MKVVDQISDWLALVAAILMVLTGVFLTWEVAGRYLFRAPTTWAQEVSDLCLLWAVFVAIAAMIRRRQNIAIDVLFAAVLTCTLLGLTVFVLVNLASQIVLRRWNTP